MAPPPTLPGKTAAVSYRLSSRDQISGCTAANRIGNVYRTQVRACWPSAASSAARLSTSSHDLPKYRA